LILSQLLWCFELEARVNTSISVGKSVNLDQRINNLKNSITDSCLNHMFWRLNILYLIVA